ncbi:MAG: glycosyltransferase family 2 protein [Nitrospirota bacterium]|nr:glycosyltransferase family 2 protein [Nitrospirota bacterium]
MTDAAIGVVIPAYNAGDFLGEAIESIRAQTWENWECLIVDDGSTDETPLLLSSYRDPRIRSVRQANCGEREARLTGFSLTRAPKIVFLDADDRLLPDALTRYSSFLDDHPSVGVAYGERVLIDKEGRSFGSRAGAFLNKHPEGDVLESILVRPFLSTPSQACMRREVVPPAKWLAGRGKLGDWVLLAGSAFKGRFAYMGKSPLVEYRIHGNSQLRSLASDPQSAVGVQEYDEVLDSLFAFPGLESRFGVGKLSQLRRVAESSCLAIKGQEFLRGGEYRTAQRYFRAALRAGSRDIRDLLCWLATFSPSLLRLAEPLYGAVNPNK